MLPKSVLYYGKDEPLPERIPLRAGPLTLVYEAGDLRYITLGKHEVIRRIYVAIRDHNWDTILPALTNVQMEIGEHAFRITYDVENRRGNIDFRWQGVITGAADGMIRFSMNGQAHSAFLRNRIGFCVLHPMSSAGAPARIQHVDGTVDECPFPTHIAPQLVVDGLIKPVHPFAEMAALAHEVTPGVWARVEFAGEIFETEDQRNWTDASFKSYGTPLRLPFPAAIQQGERVVQSITVALTGERLADIEHQTSNVESQPLTFQVLPGEERRALPQLGLGVASHGESLSDQELARLRALNLSHLRIDLHLAQPDFAKTLQRAANEARTLGVVLEIALYLSDNVDEELQRLTEMVANSNPPVARWLVFHQREKTTTTATMAGARSALRLVTPTTPIGGGTALYFTELNASRPPVAALDMVAYSINPQVHAFDNASLAETLAAQAATATSARQFCADRPLYVGPVTLLPRFNPNATGPEAEPAPGELPAQVDVRQMSLFGAGWTLGSIKYLAECGEVAGVTYFETTGWRGVIERAQGSSLSDKFCSLPGGVFPLYHLLADVGEFAGGMVAPSQSSDPLAVEGLTLYQGDRVRVLLANLTGEPQSVSVAGLGDAVQVRFLDETNAEAAMQAPEDFRTAPGEWRSTGQGQLLIELPPYALARMDGT